MSLDLNELKKRATKQTITEVHRGRIEHNIEHNEVLRKLELCSHFELTKDTFWVSYGVFVFTLLD